MNNDNRFFDFFKHLTTLNFAGIGFLVLVIEQNLVRVPKEEAFSKIFFSFAASLICSFVLMFFNIAKWNVTDETRDKWLFFLFLAGIVALCGFLFGLLQLAVATGVVIITP